MTDIKITKIYEEFPELYQVDNHDIFISKSPVSNCQTYTIGGIEQILYKGAEAKSYLKAIQNTIDKSQVLVDISKKWIETFENLVIEGGFIIKNEYTNSTGNPMVLCLVRTTYLKT